MLIISFFFINVIKAKNNNDFIVLDYDCIKYDKYEREHGFDVYYDGNQELIYKDGKFAGYIYNKKNDEDNKILNKMKANDKTDLKDKSYQILKDIVGYRVKYYNSYNYVYNFDYNLHIYTYVVNYNNIETDDAITIRFDNYGNLISINSPYQGIFDNVDVDVSDDYFEKYVDKIYSGYKYNIDYYTLRKDDNGFYLQGLVGINKKGYYYTERIEVRL